MKKLLFILSALFVQVLYAQDSLHFKPVPYKVAIYTGVESRERKGYIDAITDTSLFISSIPVNFHGPRPSGSRSTEINYRDISAVNLRRKGGGGKGLLIGTLAGGVVGVVAGLAAGDDTNTQNFCIVCTAADKAKMGGIISGLVGGVVGAGVGSLTGKSFSIKNKKENFDEMRRKLIY